MVETLKKIWKIYTTGDRSIGVILTIIIIIIIAFGSTFLPTKAHAEWPYIQKEYFDDFGDCIQFIDRDLDGAGDLAKIWIWYPDRGELSLYAITTHELGEKIRLDAIEIDRKAREAKRNKRGGIAA